MNQWKTIITFTYPHEAHLAKNFLESNDIEVHIKDEMIIQVINFYSNAIGGVKLQVHVDNVMQGLELLRKGGYTPSDNSNDILDIATLEAGSNTLEDVCPFCQSDNIGKINNLSAVSVVIFFIIGVLFPLFKNTKNCYECHKKWTYKHKNN